MLEKVLAHYCVDCTVIQWDAVGKSMLNTETNVSNLSINRPPASEFFVPPVTVPNSATEVQSDTTEQARLFAHVSPKLMEFIPIFGHLFPSP